jgi:hypothetical protein
MSFLQNIEIDSIKKIYWFFFIRMASTYTHKSSWKKKEKDKLVDDWFHIGR